MTQACRIIVGVDVDAADDFVAGASVPSSVAQMVSFHLTDTEETP